VPAEVAPARRSRDLLQLLSETGGGNTASCEKDVAAELSFLKAHSDLFVRPLPTHSPWRLAHLLFADGLHNLVCGRVRLVVRSFRDAERQHRHRPLDGGRQAPPLLSGPNPWEPSLIDSRRASRAALPLCYSRVGGRCAAELALSDSLTPQSVPARTVLDAKSYTSGDNMRSRPPCDPPIESVLSVSRRMGTTCRNTAPCIFNGIAITRCT
jgi:hypothetical protein